MRDIFSRRNCCLFLAFFSFSFSTYIFSFCFIYIYFFSLFACHIPTHRQYFAHVLLSTALLSLLLLSTSARSNLSPPTWCALSTKTRHHRPSMYTYIRTHPLIYNSAHSCRSQRPLVGATAYAVRSTHLFRVVVFLFLHLLRVRSCSQRKRQRHQSHRHCHRMYANHRHHHHTFNLSSIDPCVVLAVGRRTSSYALRRFQISCPHPINHPCSLFLFQSLYVARLSRLNNARTYVYIHLCIYNAFIHRLAPCRSCYSQLLCTPFTVPRNIVHSTARHTSDDARTAALTLVRTLHLSASRCLPTVRCLYFAAPVCARVYVSVCWQLMAPLCLLIR